MGIRLEKARELQKYILAGDKAQALNTILDELADNANILQENVMMANLKKEHELLKGELDAMAKEITSIMDMIAEIKKGETSEPARGTYHPDKKDDDGEGIANRICRKCGNSFYSKSGRERVCPTCKKKPKDIAAEVAEKEKEQRENAGIDISEIAKELVGMEEE